MDTDDGRDEMENGKRSNWTNGNTFSADLKDKVKSLTSQATLRLKTTHNATWVFDSTQRLTKDGSNLSFQLVGMTK